MYITDNSVLQSCVAPKHAAQLNIQVLVYNGCAEGDGNRTHTGACMKHGVKVVLVSRGQYLR
jgi:hypothetical protein